MGNKLERMMTSLDGLLTIMSHNSLITWPCEISHHRLLVFLLLLLLLVSIFGRTAESCLAKVLTLVTKEKCDENLTHSLDTIKIFL